MKRIFLTLGCFCLVALNPVYAQATNGVKTEQVEEKMHACCKAKGGSDQCCKKGLANKEVKSQCSTENCGKQCCKSKGASFEKKSWWKFW